MVTAGMALPLGRGKPWVNWKGNLHPVPVFKVRLPPHGCIQLTPICSAGVC